MSARFPKEVARKVDELMQLIQERKMAIFCGAGISLNAPSNLPTAGMLRKAILKHLLEVDKLPPETQKLLEIGAVKENEKGSMGSGEKNTQPNRYYPFEAFIQIVDKNAPILETLVEIYKGGKPNKNHILLAEFLKQGHVREVLTTNFDTKLEDALKQLDRPNGKGGKNKMEFKIFYKESDFLTVNFSQLKQLVIWKLHGTVQDLESLRTTLETISSRELSEARARILRHFFQESIPAILIIGYSGSDEFDVNPVLKGMKSGTYLFLIRHLPRGSKEPPKVSPLEYPFDGFQGVMIQCNTDEILDYLWEKWLATPWGEHKKSEAWKQALRKWSQGLQEGRRSFTAAHVLYEIREYPWAETLFKKSLETFQRLKDQNGIIAALYQLATLQYYKGDYKKAKTLCKRGLKLAERLEDQTSIINSFHQLALLHQAQGEYEEAEKLYRQNLERAKQLKDPIIIAASLHQLATLQAIRGNYTEAESLYRQNLKIREQIGDLTGVSHSLHQLARLHHARGDYEAAESQYRQSLEIKERLGDPRGIANSLHQLARIQHILENYEKAETLYQQSLELFRRLEDRASIATSFSALGSLAEQCGDLNKAESYYENAWVLFHELGHYKYEEAARAHLVRLRTTTKQKKKRRNRELK